MDIESLGGKADIPGSCVHDGGVGGNKKNRGKRGGKQKLIFGDNRTGMRSGLSPPPPQLCFPAHDGGLGENKGGNGRGEIQRRGEGNIKSSVLGCKYTGNKIGVIPPPPSSPLYHSFKRSHFEMSDSFNSKQN